jgi:hypothetical protein
VSIRTQFVPSGTGLLFLHSTYFIYLNSIILRPLYRFSGPTPAVYRTTLCATSRWKQTNGTLYCSLSSTGLLKIRPLPLINLRPASCDLPSQGRCPQPKYRHLQYVTRYCGFTSPPLRLPRLRSTGRQQKIWIKRRSLSQPRSFLGQSSTCYPLT